jgi:23S rRNA (adenine2030-N6)-methyltransferase
MNYSHAFHAGGFTDLLKHAVLTQLLRSLATGPTPLVVIDVHAGAGIYDLQADAARRTGEAEAGIGRLMSDGTAPSAFDDLIAEVRRANRGGEVRFYPGSPLLIANRFRPGDGLIACELRADDFAALKSVLGRHAGARALNEDGWRAAAQRSPPPPARVLVLIDPPFERPDDRHSIESAVKAVLRRNPKAVIAIWAPIKDLTGLDDLIGAVEDACGRAALLTAQVRLRPLTDPMRLNGCAMLVINPPAGVEAAAAAAAEWIAVSVGEPGATGRAAMEKGAVR